MKRIPVSTCVKAYTVQPTSGLQGRRRPESNTSPDCRCHSLELQMETLVTQSQTQFHSHSCTDINDNYIHLCLWHCLLSTLYPAYIYLWGLEWLWSTGDFPHWCTGRKQRRKFSFAFPAHRHMLVNFHVQTGYAMQCGIYVNLNYFGSINIGKLFMVPRGWIYTCYKHHTCTVIVSMQRFLRLFL